MPLNGTGHSSLVSDDAPYFKSLADFDTWADNAPPPLSGVLPYHPRSVFSGVSHEHRGKLLVCHDYKGGYTESPSALSYTFNFWPYCEAFIYFSHHRVTVPPSGWVTAAHRQGVKMLGTLIFEGADEGDCLRLLVGRLPQSRTGPARSSHSTAIPISPHYARLLAKLAQQRGFDGYLLNFECPLRGGIEQTRALASWITLLERELRRNVGPHSQVVWYDSVIADGRLRWQDRLNSFNLPFFIPSSGFFTNYTWPPHYPSLTAQYFLSIDAAHLSNPRPKSLQDIFVGIDVWGRGSHGGGGFGVYKAMNHIDPQFLGLSVALFGQAWTWETKEGKPDWSWENWWAYERKLWLGPENPGELVPVPDPPKGQLPCEHGPFAPIASFFPCIPPPDPLHLVLCTSFSPGIGKAWFVEGVKVMQTVNGWTDLDKVSSIGDLAWPRPTVHSELEQLEESIPVVSSSLCVEDAWIGGSSLRLNFSLPESESVEASFQCVWIPVQSLALTIQQSYDARLVFKVDSGDGLDVDVALVVRSLLKDVAGPDVDILTLVTRDLTHGWSEIVIRLSIKSEIPCHLAAIGLVVGIAREEPIHQTFSILLGQISVYPSPPNPPVSIGEPRLLWADYESVEKGGIVTWEVAHSLPLVSGLPIKSAEDPDPAWTLDRQPRTFLYFNIYVVPVGADTLSEPSFIGTTGLDGRANRFFVDPACLPHGIDRSCRHLRFIVQGVTDRGDVLSQEHCVFVDVEQPN